MNNELLVRYSSHNLNNEPFDEQIILAHLNTELVHYSDPNFKLFLLVNFAFVFLKLHSLSLFSRDLNNELVRYSDHGDLFDHQMVFSSDHHLVNRPLFRPPFEYQSAIQMPGSMVPAI